MIVIHLKVQGTESAVLLKKKKKKGKGIMRDKTSSLSKNKKKKKQKKISAASVMLGNQCNFGEIFHRFFR